MGPGEADIPLWIKVADTLFVCVLVPVYVRHYGPANFLWFSDVALLVTVPALWIESRLLASMMALAVILPELAWNLDFFGRLFTRRHLLGLAAYMFDPDTSLLLRGLSLFHVFLPVLLLWMLRQVGYDARAFVAQTVLGEVLLVLTYAFTDPSKNINWVFGPGPQPQRRVPSAVYLAAVMVFFPVCVYWPTHQWLRRVLLAPR
ncbi:MAG TPA: membrane-associated protein [Actinomycetota bacterium]